MNEQRTRFDAAVNELVAILSPDELRKLDALVLNHQVQESWPWYEMVLSRFLAGQDALPLIREIDELFPDESALRLIEATSDAPIFEAKIILRESQKVAKLILNAG